MKITTNTFRCLLVLVAAALMTACGTEEVVYVHHHHHPANVGPTDYQVVNQYDRNAH